MAKQSKKPADLNRLAAAIVGEATDNEIDSDSGRGAAGGKARAAALSSEKRTEIARNEGVSPSAHSFLSLTEQLRGLGALKQEFLSMISAIRSELTAQQGRKTAPSGQDSN